MKESQEIVDYLEIDHAEKSEYGSRLILTKENFSVSLRALGSKIVVEFIPPKEHYEEQQG